MSPSGKHGAPTPAVTPNVRAPSAAFTNAPIQRRATAQSDPLAQRKRPERGDQ
jgi:hypothetical protein